MSFEDDDITEIDDLEKAGDSELLDDPEVTADEPVKQNAVNDERDDLGIGKRASKRINKLVYERNIERVERLKLAAEVAENTRIIQELRAQKEEDMKLKTEADIRSKRSELLSQKREALEVGNSDDVIRIDEQLFELHSNQRNQSNQQPEPRQQQQPNPQYSQQPSYSQAAIDWMNRNPWVNDPKQKARYDTVNSVYLKMVQEQGYDPEDPETYDILDRRFTQRQAPPSVGGGVDRGNLAGANSGLTITQADKVKMRQWNLDPDDPIARKAWLDSKRKVRDEVNG